VWGVREWQTCNSRFEICGGRHRSTRGLGVRGHGATGPPAALLTHPAGPARPVRRVRNGAFFHIRRVRGGGHGREGPGKRRAACAARQARPPRARRAPAWPRRAGCMPHTPPGSGVTPAPNHYTTAPVVAVGTCPPTRPAVPTPTASAPSRLLHPRRPRRHHVSPRHAACCTAGAVTLGALRPCRASPGQRVAWAARRWGRGGGGAGPEQRDEGGGRRGQCSGLGGARRRSLPPKRGALVWPPLAQGRVLGGSWPGMGRSGGFAWARPHRACRRRRGGAGGARRCLSARLPRARGAGGTGAAMAPAPPRGGGAGAAWRRERPGAKMNG
jgi:hypothetical protein